MAENRASKETKSDSIRQTTQGQKPQFGLETSEAPRFDLENLQRLSSQVGGAALLQNQMLTLQRTVGNARAQRLIQREENPVITAPLGGSTHTVVSGDTLWSIAQRTYGEGTYWRQIYEANSDKIGRGGNLILIDTALDLPTIDVPVASGYPTDHSQGPTPPQPTPSPAPAPSTTPSQASPVPAQTTTPAAGGDTSDGQTVSRHCAYPAFRYNLQSIPVAVAPMPIPGGMLTFTLSLRGNLTTQKVGSCLPWSIDQTGLRVEATQRVEDFTSGIRVNSIGSDSMSLGTTLAGEFSSSEVRFIPPSSMQFISQARPINFEVEGLRITGDMGYDMRVDFVPMPNSPAPERVTAPEPVSQTPQWVEELGMAAGVALIAGGVAIGIATIAEDVVTLGAGILDDPVSFGVAAAMIGRGLQAVR